VKRAIAEAHNQTAIRHFSPVDGKKKPSSDASARFSTPRVLHLSGSSTLQRCNVTTGIICLLAGSAEEIGEMGLKLEAGKHQSRDVIDLVCKYAGRRSHRDSEGRTELIYGGQVLISGAHSQYGGSWIPFPGGSMADDQFIVCEQLLVPGTRRCQYLVVVQQPEYSMLELCVNALLPSDFEPDVQTRLGSEDQSVSMPLLPMKGGWAVGGQLASRVLRLITKYGNK